MAGWKLLALSAACFLGALVSSAFSQELPAEAKALIDAAERKRIAIQKQAEAEIELHQAKLVRELKDLERQLRLQGNGPAAGQVAEAVGRISQGEVAEKSGQESIEVEWQGDWWPAVILKTDGKRSYIHYENYGPEWDEWVGPERIRPAPKKIEIPATNWRYEIESGGAWYRGDILKTGKDRRSLVIYQANGIEWQEWVAADRIRPLPK